MGHHLFPEFTVAGVCSVIPVYFTDNNAFVCSSWVVRRGVHVCSRVCLFDMSFKIEESRAVKSGSFKDGYIKKGDLCCRLYTCDFYRVVRSVAVDNKLVQFVFKTVPYEEDIVNETIPDNKFTQGG